MLASKAVYQLSLSPSRQRNTGWLKVIAGTDNAKQARKSIILRVFGKSVVLSQLFSYYFTCSCYYNSVYDGNTWIGDLDILEGL